MGWAEKGRAAFVEAATKRGFKNTRFVLIPGQAAIIMCDDGRKGDGEMDEADQRAIFQYLKRRGKI